MQDAPHPHTMMTSEEVDWLVYSYLQESGYTHTSFSLLHESALAGPSTSSGHVNGRKHTPSSVFGTAVPPGHLVQILQKGLLYLEAEARYRGDPPEPAPRLVGYTIPNALPLPPLPKNTSMHSSASPPAASAAPSNETSNSRPSTAKDKGKGKEITNGKRKGSDREDGGDGKRPRVVSGGNGDKKKGGKTTASRSATAAATNGDEHTAMDTDKDPPAPSAGKRKSAGGSSTRSASPAVARSQSPSTTRGNKSSASNDAVPNSSASTTSALASFTSKSSAAARANSSTSAPTSPTLAPVALPSTTSSGKNGERRSSLPEGVKKQQAELAKVKKEESEAMSSAAGGKRKGSEKQRSDGDGDVEMAPPPVDMTNVLQLGAEDAEVIRLRGHTLPKVQPCAWNPKVPAMLATGGGDSTCRIWDCPKVGFKDKSNKNLVVQDNVICKHSSAQRRADVAAVAWDPSGSLLATGSEDGIARIWTPSGDLHLVLSMHQRTIFSLKWNAAGTMLLTGSLDGTVCLWELNSGRVKQQWSTHSDSVLDVDWNDDQTFASASMDKTIHLFNISRVSPVHRFKGHRDEINVVKFSPCGTLLASCADDHSVRIWSLANIPGLTLGDRLTEQDKLRKIDDEDHGGVIVLEGHGNDVHAVAWAPQTPGEPRLLASASFDATARLWDVDAGTCLYTFARHSDFVYSISFSPGDGDYLATGSNDSKLNIWSVKDRKLLLEYEHPGPIYEIAWHPNATQVAVCGRAEDVACVSFDPTRAGKARKAAAAAA